MGMTIKNSSVSSFDATKLIGTIAKLTNCDIAAFEYLPYSMAYKILATRTYNYGDVVVPIMVPDQLSPEHLIEVIATEVNQAFHEHEQTAEHKVKNWTATPVE